MVYEIYFRKTYRIEEEEDHNSGMIEINNYCFDEGRKRFDDMAEMISWINDQKEYQSEDDSKDKYSHIRNIYVDRIDQEPLIVGIAITNTKNSGFTGEIEVYNDETDEYDTEAIDLQRTEEETIWVDIQEIDIRDIVGDELIGMLGLKEE